MKLFSLMSMFLVCCSVACAQSFVIGATKEETRAEMGTPDGIYSLAFKKLFPLRDEQFAIDSGKVEDVWEQKARNNTFQYRAFYVPDPSVSRLHPILRLASVEVIPDRDAPGMVLLDEIPAGRELCVKVCTVTAERIGDMLSVYVCGQRDAASQTAARGSATWWSGEDDGRSYSVCAQLDYGRHPELSRRKLDAISFRVLKVDTLRFGGYGSPFDVGETSYIGTWVPSLQP